MKKDHLQRTLGGWCVICGREVGERGEKMVTPKKEQCGRGCLGYVLDHSEPTPIASLRKIVRMVDIGRNRKTSV